MRIDANELFRSPHAKLFVTRSWRFSRGAEPPLPWPGGEDFNFSPQFLHAPLRAINFQTAAMIKWDWMTGPWRANQGG